MEVRESSFGRPSFCSPSDRGNQEDGEARKDDQDGGSWWVFQAALEGLCVFRAKIRCAHRLIGRNPGRNGPGPPPGTFRKLFPIKMLHHKTDGMPFQPASSASSINIAISEQSLQFAFSAFR
jgi:hypothetical protein